MKFLKGDLLRFSATYLIHQNDLRVINHYFPSIFPILLNFPDLKEGIRDLKRKIVEGQHPPNQITVVTSFGLGGWDSWNEILAELEALDQVCQVYVLLET